MKLLENREGVASFCLYKGEEVCVYEDKIMIGDKSLPVGKNVYYSTNADYYCVDDLLYEQSDDENDVTILSRFDGNTFVEDKFRYEDKKYINSRRSCSYEFIDGVVRVSSYTDGEESLFEFEAKKRYVVLALDNNSEILVLRIGGIIRQLLFYTKTGERLWEYNVKDGYEISEKGVTIVDNIIVIPCKENDHPMFVEGYHILTGEKLWEVNGEEYCNYAYVMGPNKMLYALQSYYCADHRVELHLTELNPFTGEVDMKVIKEGDDWGDVHVLDTTIHGNKLFYLNQNKKIGRSLGVVDLDTKEVIEDFALEAKGYHVGKPVVTDEKVYVLIYFDDVTQNELRIYANEYN